MIKIYNEINNDEQLNLQQKEKEKNEIFVYS